MITLTLPYPISANRYWHSFVLGKRIMTAPTKEAKAYKATIATFCHAAGVRKPIEGRVAIAVQLYPQRPQDWAKRAARDPENWDNDVRCIDLDNANKVLLDSLKGVAIVDDGWQVRTLHSERMEPDGDARLVVTITPLHVEPAQPGLALDEPVQPVRQSEHEDLPF